MNVSDGSATCTESQTRLRQYRANAFFCDARHSQARRTQLW